MVAIVQMSGAVYKRSVVVVVMVVLLAPSAEVMVME